MRFSDPIEKLASAGDGAAREALTHAKQKRHARRQWHAWFAWHPVYVADIKAYVWLETVCRRQEPTRWGWSEPVMAYRLHNK